MTKTDNMSGDAGMASRQNVTAFFDSRAEAEAAVRRIEAEGVASADVRMVEGRDETVSSQNGEERGFFEVLGDFFMPDEDRYSYAEGLNRGGYLVSVTATTANRDRILDILDDEGTIDMDQREAEWRDDGWTGLPSSRDGAVGGIGARQSQPVDGTIEVVEENLRVGKRETDHGRVRVRSYVIETPVEEEVILRNEQVHVARRPVDRVLSAGEGVFDERTLEATEHHEEAVVSKEVRVTEEITLETEAQERTETVRDTVRRTEVEIDDDRLEDRNSKR